ncbi:MAG: hypothetical protein ABIQ16_06115 [Polyangiaceae bacterium]
MISTQSSDGSYDAAMPAPVIPTRSANWFMKALWALALMMVIGMVYSFWRISTVASPRLEVPQTTTDSTQGR